jgi:formylglycine-generating enzyme required for sulfatase activity
VTARYQEDLDAIAWYGENSHGETHEVGQKQPNAWGLYDMLGNVRERCEDGWSDYLGTAAVDPITSAEAGALRVIRGGSWSDPARVVRSAYRSARGPAYRYDYLGFRCSSSE